MDRSSTRGRIPESNRSQADGGMDAYLTPSDRLRASFGSRRKRRLLGCLRRRPDIEAQGLRILERPRSSQARNWGLAFEHGQRPRPGRTISAEKQSLKVNAPEEISPFLTRKLPGTFHHS